MSRSTTRTRPKKLNPKQTVSIVREDQVDSFLDYDNARGLIETGVEKAEEAEYHLQQAIKASQAAKADNAVKDAYIPTPPTIASDVQYDVLYPQGFQQPATYIRSSATVEDCGGVAYCMDEEDELALKLINAKLPVGQEPCSENHFEEVINFFEEAAQAKQPFAVVDSPPVLPLEELQEQFGDTIPEFVHTWSKLVYDHWKSRRTTTSNRGLLPHLKFETGQDSDDSDPYVCFRRRELRQIRKTRNRDAQSAEKLRKLRLELETARNILLMVKRREQLRKDMLEIDRHVFEQRGSLRDTKRKLGIKGDDELLINQKKQKLPPGMSPNQAALAQQLRLPLAAGPGTDLRTLEDLRAEKQRGIDHEIQLNVEKHIRWNEGFVDKTKAPLTPDTEKNVSPKAGEFREAMPATYLPTPPASISDEETQQSVDNHDVEMKEASRSSTPFRYASPVEEDPPVPLPSFRRRVGRGGRVIFDRHFPVRPKRDVPEYDKWKYDSDHSDVEESDEVLDDNSFAHMSQRAYLFGNSRISDAQAHSVRRAQLENINTNHPPAQIQQNTAVT